MYQVKRSKHLAGTAGCEGMDINVGLSPRTEPVSLSRWRSAVYRDWTFAGILAACLLAFAPPGVASPDLWGTGAAWPSDDPGFEGYWRYCYEIQWSGLPHAVSHIEILLCRPGDCDCGCHPEFFAFADTVGHGPGDSEQEHLTVHYYGGLETSGDPSTGLGGMLLKFEPYEGLAEPDLEGSANLCFYSVTAPIHGAFPDQISIKFGGDSALGCFEGPLPACRQGYSPTDARTWGYVKSVFR